MELLERLGTFSFKSFQSFKTFQVVPGWFKIDVGDNMIFGRHSVLKRGCSTWDPAQVPQAEFQARLDAVRREMARRDLDALVIYGDNYSFADLCYLTNYFPKVRGGIAVVPRDGAISMLLNIGSRDVPFAKTFTWVEDVRASNQVGSDGAKMIKEKGFEKAKVGLADSGHGFPLPQLEDMKTALPNVSWQDCDDIVAPLRLAKTARELGAMSEAGRLLSEVCAGAARFIKSGRKEYEIVADIDRLARDKGAEDIRILAGENRFNPPSFKQAASIGSHWALYLAVQHERYWAEAGRTFILTAMARFRRPMSERKKSLRRWPSSFGPMAPLLPLTKPRAKSWASSTPKPPSMVSPTASASINGKRHS